MARRPDRLPIIVAAALLGTVGIADAASPPLDCRKAQRTVEREICASSEFVAMDREIAALYDRGMAQLSGDDRHKLASSQVSFVRRRGGCDWAAHHSAHPGVAVEECVRGAMETRIRTLRDVVDHGRFRRRFGLDRGSLDLNGCVRTVLILLGVRRTAA